MELASAATMRRMPGPAAAWYAGDMRLAVLVLLLVSACDRRVAGGSTDGAKVFAAACARCHGERGQPSAQMASQLGVRDLTSPEFIARRTPELVLHQVQRGSSNGRMPAFTGAITDAQMKAVAAYVMTLGR